MQPGQVPYPQPQPHEETPLPIPHLPPPIPTIPPLQMANVVPASRVKRKHKFELVIEIPAKRFKALNHPTLNFPPNPPTASSSNTISDTGSSAVITTNRPAGNSQNHLPGGVITHKLGTTFKVDLDPKIRNISVTRDFMRAHFGAGPYRSFCQIPKAQFEKHGYDHFVFIRGVRATK